MKMIGALLLALLILPVCDAQNSSVGEIQKVITDQQAAWNRHDLDAFMSGYWNSPELTFFSGDNIAHGWQQAIDRYEKPIRAREKKWAGLSSLN